MDEDALVKVAEFIIQNLEIFEQLGKFLKRKKRRRLNHPGVEANLFRLTLRVENQLPNIVKKKSWAKAKESHCQECLGLFPLELVGNRCRSIPRSVRSFSENYLYRALFADAINDEVILPTLNSRTFPTTKAVVIPKTMFTLSCQLFAYIKFLRL